MQIFFDKSCLRKALLDYTKPQQRKKGRVREDIYTIKFIDFRLEGDKS